MQKVRCREQGTGSSAWCREQEASRTCRLEVAGCRAVELHTYLQYCEIYAGRLSVVCAIQHK